MACRKKKSRPRTQLPPSKRFGIAWCQAKCWSTCSSECVTSTAPRCRRRRCCFGVGNASPLWTTSLSLLRACLAGCLLARAVFPVTVFPGAQPLPAQLQRGDPSSQSQAPSSCAESQGARVTYRSDGSMAQRCPSQLCTCAAGLSPCVAHEAAASLSDRQLQWKLSYAKKSTTAVTWDAEAAFVHLSIAAAYSKLGASHPLHSATEAGAAATHFEVRCQPVRVLAQLRCHTACSIGVPTQTAVAWLHDVQRLVAAHAGAALAPELSEAGIAAQVALQSANAQWCKLVRLHLATLSSRVCWPAWLPTPQLCSTRLLTSSRCRAVAPPAVAHVRAARVARRQHIDTLAPACPRGCPPDRADC